MSIAVYDSVSREKAPLQTLEPGRVGMYVCGPTVYDDCHIGHLMGPVLFDAVARWLRYRGYAVRFVNNITDIDDKIITRSLDSGEPWQAITERYTAQYLGFLDELRVATVTDHPRCSDYVEAIVAYVQELVGRDIAYPAADGVYFDLTRHADYGKLSGRKAADMLAGARIERDAGLRNPGDFCLWKLAKPGEPQWPSPWGAGRPGWHIECTVMSSSLLGATFDIHGGGDDLKFPHHENEIAQGESHGGSYARTWMHNGLIQYEGAKISKSDPRMKDPVFAGQFKARHLLDSYGAPAIRFFLLQGHYRRPFDFAPQHIVAARTALLKLHKQLGELIEQPLDDAPPSSDGLDRPFSALCDKFHQAMDDDFNTGAAIGHLFALASLVRKAETRQSAAALRLLCSCGRLLGLFQPGDAAALAQAGRTHAGRSEAGAGETGAIAPLIELLLTCRAEAKARRDFAQADAIRKRLGELGYAITDGPQGSTWAPAE